MVDPLNLKECKVNENVDVLSGRGRRTIRNPGNIQFRTWVDYFRPEYQRSCKTDKIKISARIVAMVGCCGGRFLEYEEGSQQWVLLSDQRAMQKTSQALRENPSLVPVPEGMDTTQQPLSPKDDNSSNNNAKNNNNNNHHHHHSQSQDDNLPSTTSTTNADGESPSIHQPKFLKFCNSARVLQRTKELLGARSKSSSSSSPKGSLISASSSSPSVPLSSPSSKQKANRKKSPKESVQSSPANSKLKSRKKRRTTTTTSSSSLDGSKEQDVVNNHQNTTASSSSIIIIDNDDVKKDNLYDDSVLRNRPDDQTLHRSTKLAGLTPRTIDNHKIRATTLALDDSFGSSSSDDDDDDDLHHQNHDGSNEDVSLQREWGDTTMDKRRVHSLNYQLVPFPALVVKRQDEDHDDDDDKDELARFTAWHDSSECMAMSTVSSQIMQDPTESVQELVSFSGQPLQQQQTGAMVLPVKKGNATKNTRSSNPHILPQPQPRQHHHHHDHYQQFFGPGNWMFGGSIST